MPLSLHPSLPDRLLDAAVAPSFSRLGFYLRGLHRRPVTTSMVGRTVVVTGATSGLGRETALTLGRLGAEVVVVGRRPQAAAAVAAEVTAAGGRGHHEVADLSLMGEVRDLAGRLLHRHPALHVLVNNVGVLLPRYTETTEGIEATFATNLLGQFLLTRQLLPALTAAAPSRVVTVSSGGMYTAPLRVDQLGRRTGYRGTRAYALTKRAQVVASQLWAERLSGEGVVFHAMHPGWADTPGVRHSLPRFRAITRPLLRTAAEGADTMVWLAAAEQPATTTGGFWHDRKLRPLHRLPSTRRGDPPEALWERLQALASPVGPT